MRRKYGIVIGLAMLACVGIVACGVEGIEISDNATPAQESADAVPAMSENEIKIEELENKYNAGEFTTEDYYELADLYEAEGLTKAARDMLEECYLLYFEDETLARLADMMVNYYEEDADIMAALDSAFTMMDDSSTYGSLIDSVVMGDLVESLFPNFAEGQRNYYSVDSENTIRIITVGYEDGEPYAKITRYTADGLVALLTVNANGLQLIDAGYKLENAEFYYDGAFDMWNLDLSQKSILHEIGTIADGALDGSYTAAIASGSVSEEDGHSALAQLWLGRTDLTYSEFSGDFAAGEALTEQPNDKVVKQLLSGTDYATLRMYALSADAKNGLWVGLAAEEEAPAFTVSYLDMADLVYVDVNANISIPEEDSASAVDPGLRLRFYKGMVQYRDGNKWVNAGSVAELEAADPLSEKNIEARRAEKKAEKEEKAKAEAANGETSGEGASAENEAGNASATENAAGNASAAENAAGTASNQAEKASAPKRNLATVVKCTGSTVEKKEVKKTVKKETKPAETAKPAEKKTEETEKPAENKAATGGAAASSAGAYYGGYDVAPDPTPAPAPDPTPAPAADPTPAPAADPAPSVGGESYGWSDILE